MWKNANNVFRRVMQLQAKQMLSCLSTVSSLFCSDYFRERVLLLTKTCLESDPPILCFLPQLGWQTCTTTNTQLFSIEMRSCTLFFSRLVLNFDQPDLTLRHSLGWKTLVLVPLYQGLMNYFSKLASTHYPLGLNFSNV
jgi:hypothetical protein